MLMNRLMHCDAVGIVRCNSPVLLRLRRRHPAGMTRRAHTVRAVHQADLAKKRKAAEKRSGY